MNGISFECTRAEDHLQADFLVACEQTQPKINVPAMRALVPKESEIASCINLLHVLAKQRIRKRFEKVHSIALTADSYRNVASRDVIGITAHGCTENFDAVSAVISVEEADFSQTGDAIAEVLRKAANEVFPSDKMMISAVVTDNAPNYRAAGRSLTEDSIGCAAHLLQLVVRDVCDEKKLNPELKQLLKNVATFQANFRAHKGALNSLDGLRGSCGKKVLRPVFPVVTRWNYDFLMAVRYLALAKSFRAVTDHMGLTAESNQPSKEDSAVLRQYVRCMRPLYEATEKLCAEKKPTLCMVAHEYRHLFDSISALPASNLRDDILSSMTTRLLPAIETPSLALMAAAVAPYYSDLSKVCSKEGVIDQVMEQIVRLAVDLERVNTGGHIEAEFEDMVRAGFRSMTSQFERMSAAEKETFKDPLKYWKGKCSSKTLISLLPVVQLLLSIPATSAPVERVFSRFTYTHSSRRARLNTHVASKCVMIGSNMGYDEPPISEEEVRVMQDALNAEQKPVAVEELDEVDEEDTSPGQNEVDEVAENEALE